MGGLGATEEQLWVVWRTDWRPEEAEMRVQERS